MNNTQPDPGEPSARQSDFTHTSVCPRSTLHGEGTAAAPERIGDFTIVRVLGEGGMGTVYLAEDVRLGRKAAIKTMKLALAVLPENRVRFVREARAAAAVEHDNIVPVWQIGEAADGSPFIAMPFLQGEMLEARLKREPIQPLRIILKVAREVVDGLAAAHARGLIHRDIKPGNVWIEGDQESTDPARQVRRCKILDFGLARSVENEDVHVTASGTILGTPAYMAPEQARGEKVDNRADLFSLGVTLYRMSTGRLPFAGPNAMAVLTALATITPPPALALNKNLPQALSDLIDRLLSKDAAGRPQSAAEVAAAVRQIGKQLQARKLAPVEEARTLRDQPAQAVGDSATKTLEQTLSVKPEPALIPMAKARRGRTLLLIALALLVLAPLGWWAAAALLRVETANGTLVVEMNDSETEARIKNGKLILTGPDDKVRYTLSPSERNKEIEAGPYKIHVEGADGLSLNTSEFTLKKDDKVTVRVTMEPTKAAAKNLDPDRAAAEWVLSIGGSVKVNGEAQEIKVTADLPPEAFQLTLVWLMENKRVSDAGLAHLKDCKSLWCVGLNGDTQVSDVGLAHVKDCKNLQHIYLDHTQVSDVGLAPFKDRKNLTTLGLWGTTVSDVGLAYFKDCKNLTLLSLGNTKVTDAGLANFKDCKNLTLLDLAGTKVGDVGLAYFKDCKKLTNIRLQDTKITSAQIEDLKKALPQCKIEWNGGVIEPGTK